MMKHFLTLVIFAFIIQLLAQTDPDLDLGNVVIQGETSNLTDSVSYQRDFAFYNSVYSETELGFKPQFQPAEIARQIPDFGSKIAFQALGGISSASINAAFTQGEILNFCGEYYSHRIKKNWNYRNLAISWQPQVNEYDIITSIYNLAIKDSIAKTQISSYKFMISTPAYNIETKIPFELNVDFSLVYLAAEQSNKNEHDMNLSADINAHSAEYNAHLNAKIMSQAFSGFSSFGLNNIFVGKPQIWLGYDEIHLYPSLSFDRFFKITSGFELQLANLPQISKLDRNADFNDNIFQFIIGNKLQEKQQLNAYLAIHNENYLPFVVYYNPTFIEDKEMYVSSISGYYYQISKDLFIQSFGADFSWKLKDFEIENSFEYLVCDKEIYFEPKIKLLNSVNKLYRSFTGNIEMNFLSDRNDDAGNKMDDFFQVNANLEFKFKANFTLFGYAENLLNTNYRKYHNIPHEGINLYIGCRYGF